MKRKSVTYLNQLRLDVEKVLAEIDELRTGIGLRAAAPGNTAKPIDIYKKEGFTIFQDMVEAVDKQIVNLVFKLQIKTAEKSRTERRRESNVQTTHADSTNMALSAAAVQSPSGEAQEKNPMAQASQAGKQDRTIRHDGPKVGRNDPCPCGSGKKYKKCHGAG